MKPGRFRQLRKRLGWTLIQTGEELGVHPQTVWKWENGKQPIPETAAKLLRLRAADG